MPTQEILIPTTETEPVQPFRVFILKTVEACNLGCPGCYEFEGPDQSWRLQPSFMSNEVMQATAGAVAEHAETNGLEGVLIVFHGGEPLLAHRKDKDYYGRATAAFRQSMPKGCTVRFGMQTNGTLLDRETLDKCREWGIRVGISLDGVKEINDIRRPYKSNSSKSSFDDATKALCLMRDEYPDLSAALLCVVDLAADPLETYHLLRKFDPPAIGFTLPHGNWTSPPPGYEYLKKEPGAPVAYRRPYAPLMTPAKYAEWLIPIFDVWSKDPNAPRISLFDEITGLGLNQPGRLEYLGPFTPDVITVRPDGSVANVDIMSITAPGMLDLGVTVCDKDAFNKALRHPAVRARQLGRAALSKDCLNCQILDICEGEYFPHRYAAGSNPEEPNPVLRDFKNPSVFCADIFRLGSHILGTIGKLAPVGKNIRPAGEIRNERLRDIAERATNGFITAEHAVRLAVAEGALAVSKGIYPSNALLLNSSVKEGDKFQLTDWYPMRSGEGTPPFKTRTSAIGKTGVWGAFAHYLLSPERYDMSLLPPDKIYDRGLLAWIYNLRAGEYDLYAHPDVFTSKVKTLPPDTVVGKMELVVNTKDYVPIQHEPGHFGSNTEEQSVATFSVRMADVLPLLATAFRQHMDYTPLGRGGAERVSKLERHLVGVNTPDFDFVPPELTDRAAAQYWKAQQKAKREFLAKYSISNQKKTYS
ncbi:MAG TPA: radical SAM protein [Candidatus Saccharimonadales bacterium]|nr:radical SAM protein [Candidatus Saccharimonadales bacterium]